MLQRTIAFCLLAGSLAHGWPRSLPEQDSCVGRCGDVPDTSQSCQCNSVCEKYGDCCEDYQDVCGEDPSDKSCQGKCNDSFHPSDPCQCNSKCGQFGNCCPDYEDQCGGSDGLTDADLITLSEMLVDLDEDNVADKVILDLGCITQFGNDQDCSPNPLFSSVSEEVNVMPIFMSLAALYDNYNTDVAVPEDHTVEEAKEEKEFIHLLAGTQLMSAAYQFLVEKGVFTGSVEDFENYLLEIWFGLYDRGGHGKGSSGFEHVFIGEKKNGEVSGFHNWFHWQWLEKQGLINYLGYWEYVTFQEQGNGLSFTYTWDGEPKPYGSMFISTSPELEMALYTTCFLTRPDTKCHMKLKGQTVVIQTWTMAGQPFVGSSYPDWH